MLIARFNLEANKELIKIFSSFDVMLTWSLGTLQKCTLNVRPVRDLFCSSKTSFLYRRKKKEIFVKTNNEDSFPTRKHATWEADWEIRD